MPRAATKYVFDVKYIRRTEKLAADGMSITEIAQACGANLGAFNNWCKKHPELKAALDAGKAKFAGKEGKQLSPFQEYILGRLPIHLRMVWDEIETSGRELLSPARIEALAPDDAGRKSLYLHAFIYYDFNPTEAARRTHVTPSTLARWRREPEFCKLLEAIQEAKKDCVESSLMRLVRTGDVTATIFACRTLLKDRGYDDKKISIQGEVTHKHAVVQADEVLGDLSVEAARALLDAMRKRGAEPPALKEHVEDAEVVVKE